VNLSASFGSTANVAKDFAVQVSIWFVEPCRLLLRGRTINLSTSLGSTSSLFREPFFNALSIHWSLVV